MQPVTTTVYCEDCDHAIRHLDGQKAELPAYRWLCIKAPRLQAPNYVSRTLAITEPYFRCSAINPDGQCGLFAPRREAAHG